MTDPTIEPVSLKLYGQDFQAFSDALGGSFERFGFAVVADHDLDPQLVDDMRRVTKDFFALPEDTKRRYHIAGAHGARGLTPFGVETAKGASHYDLKEFWHTGRDLPPGHPYERWMRPNVWPDEIPEFRPVIGGIFSALDDLGRRILRAIARYLDLPDDHFEDKVQLGNSVLRLLHYPPVPQDGPHVRAGAHEDINVITLLLGAEEAGLQVQDRDGRWIPIEAPPGAVVCNIGDMLQRYTNHVLPSTTHRVVNPAPERRGVSRYSTPFFLHFNPDFPIEVKPQFVSKERPNRYPEPILAEDYLSERLREIKLV